MPEQWQTTDDHAPVQWQSTDDTGPTIGVSTPRSVPGFLGNVLTSTGGLIEGAVSALTHPVQTVSGIGAVPVGLAEKAGVPLEGNANVSAKMLDSLIDHWKQRYGSLDKVKETLYNDPAGVAGDVSMLLGGTSEALNLARMPEAARVAGTAANIADPLRLPVTLGGAILDKTGLVPAVSRGLTKGALRGGYKVNIDPDVLDAAVKTMNERGIPFSKQGLTDITQELANLQQQKLALARRSPTPIDPSQVELRLDQALNARTMQVNAPPDVAQIEQLRQNFRQGAGGTPLIDPVTGKQVRDPATGVLVYTPGRPMTAEQAELLKEGTYATNKYGQGAPPHLVATAEGEQALARGLKEELERSIPELTGLNQQQSNLLNLQGVLKTALTKYLNRGGFLANLGQSLIGSKEAALKTGAITGTGALLHEPVIGATVALMQGVLADPVVRQRLAMAINFAQKNNPGKFAKGMAVDATVFGRINDYAKALNGNQ